MPTGIGATARLPRSALTHMHLPRIGSCYEQIHELCHLLICISRLVVLHGWRARGGGTFEQQKYQGGTSASWRASLEQRGSKQPSLAARASVCPHPPLTTMQKYLELSELQQPQPKHNDLRNADHSPAPSHETIHAKISRTSGNPIHNNVSGNFCKEQHTGDWLSCFVWCLTILGGAGNGSTECRILLQTLQGKAIQNRRWWHYWLLR